MSSQNKAFNVRVSVGFSQLLTIEAKDPLEAEQIAKEMFQVGSIMDDLIGHEYYDGLIGIDCEGVEE